jgi:hypothetical protein
VVGRVRHRGERDGGRHQDDAAAAAAGEDAPVDVAQLRGYLEVEVQQRRLGGEVVAQGKGRR